MTSYVSPELVRATMEEHRRRADEHALLCSARAAHRRRRALRLLGWLTPGRRRTDPGARGGPEVVWLGSRRRSRPGARPPRAA